MSDEFVKYCERMVPKKGFRAFVYGHDETTKLVNSWEEYQKEIASGIWYPLKTNVPIKKKTKGKVE